MTMSAATRGLKAPNDPNGMNAHATAKVMTKNVQRGARRMSPKSH